MSPAAAALLRETFRRRAQGAVERMARDAPPELLAEALATPTDAGALARVLAAQAGRPAIQELEPLAAAIARSAAVREELVVRAGGLLGSGEVSRLLGISRQAVDKRRAAGRLLAMKLGSDWRYPAMQFGPDGQVPEGLDEVIAGMADEGPWGAMDFLMAADSVMEGRTPLEELRAGNLAIVRRLLAQRETDAYG